jgi:hypothetical protein
MQEISINIKNSLDNWSKWNEKGVHCLSKQVLGQPSTELDDIVNSCKNL